MKVIILAAGQGTRLRPLTDECPKCMVKVNGISIIERQIMTMKNCGINEEDIYIITGYRGDVLRNYYGGSKIHFIVNHDYEATNMVYSLMCARKIMEREKDIVVSYGDIIYSETVFQKILDAPDSLSVVVDDGWYEYWSDRCENPLDDAETLMYDEDNNLLEIGQKTSDLSRVQSQYIGLMRYRGEGIEKLLNLAKEAKERSAKGEKLWRTDRNYEKMYMTDLLQGLIDKGNKLKAVHINREWFEIDDYEDLKVVEKQL